MAEPETAGAQAPAQPVLETAAPAAPAATETVAASPHDTPTLLEGVVEKPTEAAKPEEPKAAEPEAKPAAETKPEDPAAAKPEAKPEAAAQPQPEAAKPAPIAYEFTMPEVLKDEGGKVDAYKAILNEHGVSPAAGQRLLDMHAEAMTDYSKQVAQQLLDNQNKVWNDTRGEWRKQVLSDPNIGGSGHETAMGAIARMRDLFVPEKEMGAFNEFLRVTGAGDHPAFLKMMHRVARRFDEPQSESTPANPRPAPNNGRPPARRLRDTYDHPRSTTTDR